MKLNWCSSLTFYIVLLSSVHLCTSENSDSLEGEDSPYPRENDRENSELSPTTPPEIIYWASWKKNITVYDKNGMAWYCFTYRQSHCSPVRPPALTTRIRGRVRHKHRPGSDTSGHNGTFINITSQTDLNNGNYYPLYKETESSDGDWQPVTNDQSAQDTTPTNFYYDPTSYNSKNTPTTKINGVAYPVTSSNTQFPQQNLTTSRKAQPVPRGIQFGNPFGGSGYYMNARKRNGTTGPTVWRIIKTVTRHRTTVRPSNPFFTAYQSNNSAGTTTQTQSNVRATISPINPTTHQAFPNPDYDNNWRPIDDGSSQSFYTTQSTATNPAWTSSSKQYRPNPRPNQNTYSDGNPSTDSYDPFEWNQPSSNGKNPTPNYNTNDNQRTEEGIDQSRGFNKDYNSNDFYAGQRKDGDNLGQSTENPFGSQVNYKTEPNPGVNDPSSVVLKDGGGITFNTDPTMSTNNNNWKGQEDVQSFQGRANPTNSPYEPNFSDLKEDSPNEQQNNPSGSTSYRTTDKTIEPEIDFGSISEGTKSTIVSPENDSTSDGNFNEDTNESTVESSTNGEIIGESVSTEAPIQNDSESRNFDNRDDDAKLLDELFNAFATTIAPITVPADGDKDGSGVGIIVEDKEVYTRRPDVNGNSIKVSPHGTRGEIEMRPTTPSRPFESPDDRTSSGDQGAKEARDESTPQVISGDPSRTSPPSSTEGPNNLLPIFSNVGFIHVDHSSSSGSPGFTARSEPCALPCALNNETKTFTCRKQISSDSPPSLNIGYCTPTPGIGHDGLPCRKPCSLTSNQLWKCGPNQYCTPVSLIQKANQFFIDSKTRVLPPTTLVNATSFPSNSLEAEQYVGLPLAEAYSSFGEPCEGPCASRDDDERSFVCMELTSGESRPCSLSSGVTSTGESCIGSCEKDGKNFFSCPINEEGDDGHCTPRFLILKSKEWAWVNSFKGDGPSFQAMGPNGDMSILPPGLEDRIVSAYTVAGDPCSDPCQRVSGQDFTSCTVVNSEERLSCSVVLGQTDKNQSCLTPCQRVDETSEYFTCEIRNEQRRSTGFCTPGILISRTDSWANGEKAFQDGDQIKEDYPSYTVYGEPCVTPCRFRGLNFAFCRKAVASSRGEWSEIGYCTSHRGITHKGDPCEEECKQGPYEFYWCTKKGSQFGYCTPEDRLPLQQQSNEGRSKNEQGTLTPELDDEAREYRKGPLARAYTVFGEPCNDTCRVLPNDKASSCKKLNSNERIPCTTNPGVTSDGNACIGPCQRNGNPFFSCPTQDDSGYCTPGFLILKASHWETLYGKGIVSTDSFDSEEADQYEGIPLAPAYTVFGHPCQNECTASPNEKETSCTKINFSVRGPCSSSSEVTTDGSPCIGPCRKNGNPFFSCPTSNPDSPGHCTPAFLIMKAKEYENKKRDKTSEKESTTFSTTKSYEEPKELEEIPFIYTAFGEPCADSCGALQSEKSTSCRIKDSDERFPCSRSSGITSDGNTCIGPCEKKADDYFSCQTKESFGYCSPKFLNSTGDERIKDKNNIDKLPDSDNLNRNKTDDVFLINYEEAEKFGDVELAPAYTVYGEPCKTACIRRSSEQTMSCTESKSEERKPCTSLDRTTIHGYPCTGSCERKDNDFFSCPTKDDDDYCTPKFLISKANSWGKENQSGDSSDEDDLMVFSFYPVDHEEARKYDQVSPAQAYSAFGEPCSDNCLVLPNESSASCTHSNQNERYPCTNSSSITSEGHPCMGPCEMDGKGYFSCSTKDSSTPGYCTPGFLILRATEWQLHENNGEDFAIPFYSYNYDEAKEYDVLPLAPSYNVYGEPCSDICMATPNDPSTTCSAVKSNERSPCTLSSGVTNEGKVCMGPCEKRDMDHFSCQTKDSNVIGYCTPGFLVLKATEWGFADNNKGRTLEGTQSSVVLYPYNLKEAKEYEELPPAEAYTAFGEPCQDSCKALPDEEFSFCTKKDSDERGLCTKTSDITSDGQPCNGNCEKYGNEYFSCPTNSSNTIGYCTPGFLIQKANEWDSKTSDTSDSFPANFWSSFSSVSFFPNPNTDSQDSSLESISLAPSYTVSGEPCLNKCESPEDDNRYFCTGINSKKNNPCSKNINTTNLGMDCIGPCERRANQRVFSCKTEAQISVLQVGYCTPNFLILKSNEWKRLNERPFDVSPNWVSYYPYNEEEAEDFAQMTPASAFSVFGKPCQDACVILPNEDSMSCLEKDSNERVPCSITSGITADVVDCSGPCEKNGNDFFSCPAENSNGYCTPTFLILKSAHWQWQQQFPYGAQGAPSSENETAVFYPYDNDEAREYDQTLPARAYNVFGEPCLDSCRALPNEKSSSCLSSVSKQQSPCTVSSWGTSDGNVCIGPCKKNGNDYFSCPTRNSNDIGYCTPGFLILKASQWTFKKDGGILEDNVPKKHSYYPYNYDEAKRFDQVPISPAYTVFGEACQDECTTAPNEASTTCTTIDSNEKSPCTKSSGVSSDGNICTGPCERKNNAFFSCPINDSNIFEYCTPGFLILKTSQWKFVNGYKGHSNETQSNSIGFFPYDHDEAKEHDQLPLAPAYTVYGEPCRDACETAPNDESTSTTCTGIDSNERSPCTLSSGVTSEGEVCTGPCEKKDKEYFSCPTKNPTEIGYCTPGFLILMSTEWRFVNGYEEEHSFDGPFSSIAFYPYNYEEAEEYAQLETAPAYNAFGQPCQNDCIILPNAKSMSCQKKDSNERVPCGVTSVITADGVDCSGSCEKNGNDFFSCPTGNSNGYCTPTFLLLKSAHWHWQQQFPKRSEGKVSSENKSKDGFFYPYDNNEAREFNDQRRPARAYTAFGEPCDSNCQTSSNRNSTYCFSSVSKQQSPCTISSGGTSDGNVCIGPCKKNGNDYFSCPTRNSTNIGYCTPGFLILKAYQWKWNQLKRRMPLHNNRNENERKPIQPSEIQDPDYSYLGVAPGYTIYGEPCSDSCESRGFNYTWCTKEIPSQTGQFNLKGYCTKETGMTHKGEPCVEECSTRGYSFNWCRKTDTSFGFCTPEELIQKSKIWKSNVTYTTYGEECRNKCAKYGYSYHWCKKKKPSSIGTWSDSDYCSPAEGLTSSGTRCVTTCESKGYDYHWCRDNKGSFSYCSPTLTTAAAAISETRKVPKAYTVFGEACTDTCETRGGYSYTWCTKIKASNIGTWTWADYCTNDSGLTPYAEPCQDACEKRGFDFYWCHKDSLWGYCTPRHLLDAL